MGMMWNFNHYDKPRQTLDLHETFTFMDCRY